MNFKEGLISLRENAIQIRTKLLFEEAKQKLELEFKKEPTQFYVSTTLFLNIGINFDVFNLSNSQLIDEEYLKHLCVDDGVSVQIYKSENQYSSFQFIVDLQTNNYIVAKNEEDTMGQK